MRLLPLAALLLLAPLSGRAAPPEPEATPELKARAAPLFAELSKEILTDRDPYASKAFLDRTDSHELLRKADPQAFDRLFEGASQLVDLHRVMVDHVNTTSLREALSKREGYPLLEKPAELLSWRKKYADYQKEDTLRAALLEWTTLPAEVRTALTAAGKKPGEWAGTGYGARSDALEAALNPAVDRLKGSVARTPAEAKALRDQAQKIWTYLDKDVKAALLQHFEKTDAASAALADAESKLGKNPDPALAAKLAEARKSGDVDGMLGKLGSLFDGMNVRNEAVERAGPGRADQRLDAAGRQALSEMLVTGVKREMAGTVVGERLLRMYAKEPFNLVVKPMPAGIMGQYTAHDNVLAVSEDLLLRMAREQGKSAGDLLKGEMFDRALKSTLSTIVHESVHQEQAVWRRDHKVPYWDVVEHEMEAKTLEAAFILQKSAQDPKGYGKFMAENQKSSVFVREGAALANKMQRSPETFRMSIQADYYPAEVSIEANAARAYDNGVMTDMRDQLRAELARRAALPRAQRTALDAAGQAGLQGRFTRDTWVAALPGLKEETLRTMMGRQEQALAARTDARAAVPRTYAEYRARDAETQALAAGVLASLSSPQPNGGFAGGSLTKTGFVPAPTGGGGPGKKK
ncbi:hypothetical protein EPO15_06995 [bacterium]|nr:MAG: hypothetical protein EPO15_06995 [bacterium]